MVSPITCDSERPQPKPSRLAASLVASISFLRILPLFVARRPKTPLRVLCLMAFDTVHVLRNSRRLSSHALETLATLLDFGACANDFLDDKEFSRQEYRATRRLLEQARTSVAVDEYWRRLCDLESQRPAPGGDAGQHRKAQFYRESVIRLSLGMIAATTLGNLTIEEGVRATYHDEDIETLYRIVMLCQIIDDFLDFATDTDQGLPSFLTAHASPPKALALTAEAATRYADRGGLPSSPHGFPFRVALQGVSVLAQVAITFGRWRLRLHARKQRVALMADR
jgi:hypothetical protein